MTAARSRTVAQRRLAWLLWFALLLPIAQAAASWHALSHGGPATSGQAHDKQAPNPLHCDRCLTATAVSGGALPSTPPQLPSLAVRHEAPQAAFSSVGLSSPASAYQSRAPPAASH